MAERRTQKNKGGAPRRDVSQDPGPSASSPSVPSPGAGGGAEGGRPCGDGGRKKSLDLILGGLSREAFSPPGRRMHSGARPGAPKPRHERKAGPPNDSS